MPEKKKRGRPKGSKAQSTIWVLAELKKAGVDYVQILANAVKSRDIELINALARLAPHIANKPKVTTDLEGIEKLVITEFKPEQK